jgi:competence protein ComEC
VTAALVALAATVRRIPRLLWRQLGIAALCLALVLSPPARRLLLAWNPDGWPPSGWRIAVCDVGQGDSTVVRTGPGSAIVIDTGPPGDAADRCLTALGVTRIPLLVLTHFHLDHVGGLAEVLAGRRVGEVLVTGYAHPPEQARMVADTLAQRHLIPHEVDTTRAPSSGTVGDVSWQLLWPAAPADRPGAGAVSDADGTPINNASLVLLITAPELSLMALGDVETESQEVLARQLERANWRRPAAIVKVAHHGSARQSRSLAALLDPDVAVISVGAGNDYGHPAASTVDLYRDGGAVVLRTDQCGAMVFGVRAGVVELTAGCPRPEAGAAAEKPSRDAEGLPCVAGCAHARLTASRAPRIPPCAQLGRGRARAGGAGHRRGVAAGRSCDRRRPGARPRAGRGP